MPPPLSVPIKPDWVISGEQGWENFGKRRRPGPVFATDLLTIGRNIFELPGSPKAASIRLGIILSKYESQVHDGWRVQRLPQSQGKTPWQLKAVPAA
jgi:hypothetical protein